MLQTLFVFAGNLVPLAGVVLFGWNPATIVAVFWVETLIHGTANVVRIAPHRRRGESGRHDKPFFGKSSKPTTFLKSYAMFFYWFTLGHGIMLMAILEGLSRGKPSEGLFIGVDLEAFPRAVGALIVLAVIELGIDLVHIADKPFSWLDQRVRQSNARVFVLHLAIIGGAGLVAAFGSATWLLVAVIVLKTGFDVAAARRR